MFGWILLAVIVGFLAYVRLAPVDAARWHQPVTAEADKTMKGGAIRVIDAAGPDALSRAHDVMLGLERTRVVAGTVEDGRVTYMTRSQAFGFPDFTTIEHSGDQLKMFARLRFGGSDLGVNGKRLERVLAALQP